MATLCDYTNVSVCDDSDHECIYFSDGHYILVCNERQHLVWAVIELEQYLATHPGVTLVGDNS